jgi:hypothetical protein
MTGTPPTGKCLTRERRRDRCRAHIVRLEVESRHSRRVNCCNRIAERQSANVRSPEQ